MGQGEGCKAFGWVKVRWVKRLGVPRVWARYTYVAHRCSFLVEVASLDIGWVDKHIYIACTRGG